MELTTQQIEWIRRDIRARGISLPELSESLLDHICCHIEDNRETDFNRAYGEALHAFGKDGLKKTQQQTKEMKHTVGRVGRDANKQHGKADLVYRIGGRARARLLMLLDQRLHAHIHTSLITWFHSSPLSEQKEKEELRNDREENKEEWRRDEGRVGCGLPAGCVSVDLGGGGTDRDSAGNPFRKAHFVLES